MRHLTDDTVLSVNDAARNPRCAIRSEASYRPIAARGTAARLPGRTVASGRRRLVAGLVDRVFADVESGALALVSTTRRSPPLCSCSPFGPTLGVSASRDDQATERLFARAHCQSANNLPHNLGARNVLTFEHVMLLKSRHFVKGSPFESSAFSAFRPDACACAIRRLGSARLADGFRT
jgi:hypothetical protein